MVQFQVQVNHGSKRVATVRVVASDKRHAVKLAENTVRTYHGIPAQVQLLGTVAR